MVFPEEAQGFEHAADVLWVCGGQCRLLGEREQQTGENNHMKNV